MINLNYPCIAAALMHNISMEKITELPNFPNVTFDEMYNLTVNQLNDLLNKNQPQFPQPSFPEIQNYINDILPRRDCFMTIVNRLGNEARISQEFRNFLNNYDTILFDRPPYDYNIDNQVNDVINLAMLSTLTETEKMICISVGNVAIASMYYWRYQSEDPNSPWYYFLQSDPDTDPPIVEPQGIFNKKWKKVVVVVAADCAGVLIGGVVGGLVGAAAAGAATVGAGASGATAKAVGLS